MNFTENKVIAEMLQDNINDLEDAETIVVHVSGPNGKFSKTFSHTLLQDFDIGKRYIHHCLRELKSAWSPNEAYDKTIMCCNIEIDIDPNLEDQLAQLGLEAIKNDRQALINYACNKALEEKLEREE